MDAHTYLPTLSDIATLFEEECNALGATGVETYLDDRLLFQRAAWGPAQSVSPGDAIRGGVALRVAGPVVHVHPYTVRQVCTNGAIAARVGSSFHVERQATEVHVASAAFVAGFAAELREAITACADPSNLSTTVEQMRGTAEMAADLMLTILPYLLRATGAQREGFISSVLTQFSASDDQTAYGLVNAVTSVARDTRDPEARWRLEEAGGSLLSYAQVLATDDRIRRGALASV